MKPFYTQVHIFRFEVPLTVHVYYIILYYSKAY